MNPTIEQVETYALERMRERPRPACHKDRTYQMCIVRASQDICIECVKESLCQES